MEGVRAAALAAGVLAAGGACAADDAQWYLQIDNDVVFNTDRYYTSGLRLARTHRSGDGQRLELGLVQEIYTPDLNHPTANDRPYVGRLFGYGARHDYAAGMHRTLEASLGVRGPSAGGRQTMELAHRIVTAPESDWSNQLPDHADLQFGAAQSQSLGFCPPDICIAHFGAAIGTTQTFAHAGAELRAGPRPVPTQLLRYAATPPLAGPAGWGAFAGVSARLVARNALLEGNADPGARDVEIKHGVVRVAAGIAWSAGWGVVTFALAQDTREFETQRVPQRFGSLAVHLAF